MSSQIVMILSLSKEFLHLSLLQCLPSSDNISIARMSLSDIVPFKEITRIRGTVDSRGFCESELKDKHRSHNCLPQQGLSSFMLLHCVSGCSIQLEAVAIDQILPFLFVSLLFTLYEESSNRRIRQFQILGLSDSFLAYISLSIFFKVFFFLS